MKMWLLWLVLVLIGAFFIGLAEVVVNKTKGKKSVSWFGRFAGGVLKVIAKIIDVITFFGLLSRGL
ncbi:hypothetical protein [Alicyclobacillus fastidiosus]|uniref:Uncharacterized protein n=1 Tax=Alicyclobacillus fastidiosus TaxID=392011 RepID=A0ABV5ALY7_9BACL|nr:hypothetical protein [Alicyclobacillus fastidiosus]WEH10592.1 hypothetical protein PYS47_05030 [Alicyclobacillus fastidiosus]